MGGQRAKATARVAADAARVAVVTGGSSGIGRACARALAEAGCAVYELSRRDVADVSPGVIHRSVDITQESQVSEAISAIIDERGRIDILVNNAGFGISGALEMTDPAEARRQLDVNLFGMDAVTRAVLPHMRQAGTGRIVCTSSIAGIVPIPFQGWYSVSKAAINAYVLALANEVRPYGVTVAALMPGDTATGFTDARRKSEAGDGDDAYAGRIARSVAVMERDERGGMSPDVAGRALARLALARKSRPLVALGASYKAVSLLEKLLPKRLVNWLVYLIYAK